MLITAVLFVAFTVRNTFAGSSVSQKDKKVKITGVVTDVNMKPVEGVRIFVDQASTNSITNAKGIYRIKVASTAKQLSAFSRLYGVQKLEIKSDLTGVKEVVINIKLVDINASNIEPAMTDGEMITARLLEAGPADDDLIDVGYGKVRRKNLTTEVNKIKGQHSYQAYSNVYDMIRGEVPGVEVVGKTIKIRDSFSFYLNTEPLLVLDGMIIPTLDDISPVDVKSIEVLKGAAASVYGSRGANGVILITTMKGGDKR